MTLTVYKRFYSKSLCLELLISRKKPIRVVKMSVFCVKLEKGPCIFSNKLLIAIREKAVK